MEREGVREREGEGGGVEKEMEREGGGVCVGGHLDHIVFGGARLRGEHEEVLRFQILVQCLVFSV